MSRFCPYCGTDASDFARCPSCNFDFGAPAEGPGPVPAAPADDWGKTTVIESAPPVNSRVRARFDQGRGEFYTPIDETRPGVSGFGETMVEGQTVAGDHTVIERSRPRESDDATIIVRSGGRRGITGPLAYLVERNGVRSGKVHLLRTETTLGRAAENDIALGDDSVSRRHAKIRVEEGTFVFWDLASANFSYLVAADGSRSRILEPRPLADGDRIDLGEARLTFLLVDSAPGENDAP